MQIIEFLTQEEYDSINSSQALVEGYTPLQYAQMRGFDFRVDAFKAMLRPKEINIGISPRIFYWMYVKAWDMTTGAPLRRMVGIDLVDEVQVGMRIHFIPSEKIGRLDIPRLQRGVAHAIDIIEATRNKMVKINYMTKARIAIGAELEIMPGEDGKARALALLEVGAPLGAALLKLRQIVVGGDELAVGFPVYDIIHEEEIPITITA